MSDTNTYYKKSDVLIDNCTVYGNEKGIKVYDSNNVTIKNCVTYDNDIGIEVSYSKGVIIEDCEIYNNGADGASLSTTSDIAIENCEFYENGDEGLYIGNSKEIDVLDCVAYNNTGEGVFTWYGDHITVEDCESYENNNGFYFWYTDYSILNNCSSRNNLIDGINVNSLENSQIINCDIHQNKAKGIRVTYSGNSILSNCVVYNQTSYGIHIDYSNQVTICNSYFTSNLYGMYVNYVNNVYLANSSFNNNTNDGIYSDISNGQILQCNIKDNNDDGFQYVKSTFNLTHCNIMGNADYGVDDNGGPNTVDGAYCWWGDPSGPYNSIANPGGTGEKVDFIDFKPWLNSSHEYKTQISDLRCHLTTKNWHMIYPSDDPGKPLVMGPAMLSDWTASGLLYSKLASVTEGVDTDPLHVDQATGRPCGEPGEAVATFGGPDVNLVTYWAENGDAPIHFVIEGDRFYFKHANGSYIPGADLSISVINFGEDMFVIEAFEDVDDRFVVILQGFGWKGSYVAGKFFDRVMCPDLESYPYGWVIVKWDDTNGDGYVNAPGDGDTYTMVATGN